MLSPSRQGRETCDHDRVSHRVLRSFVILMLAVLPALAHAAASREALPTPVDRVLADAADGSLSDQDLLTASLIAGGADDAALAVAVARYEAWLAELDAAKLPADTRAAASAIFSHMHGKLLGGEYQATCSEVAIALDRGDFNCLSATILYVCAARSCGLDASALATDGHVLCQIASENGSFEVETTCPAWFRLTAADARAAKELRLAPDRNPNAKPREVRRLSDVELLAKVYYNRGVAELRSNHYEAGLDLTRKSLQLDPRDAVARGNVLAGLNNWALALCREGDADRAAQLLAELRTLDPDYPTLADNEAHVARAKAKHTP